MDIAEQIDDLRSQVNAMRQKVLSENRSPTEAESKKANDILDEIERLKRKPATEVLVKPDPQGDYTTRSTDKMDNEFKNDGEYFQAVARASVPNGTMDKRLESRAASGMGISIPSDGGFIVSEDFSQTVNKMAA